MKDNPKDITYLLTYDHGGYVAWGGPFLKKLEEAEEWLEKYPSFKIGLDNECFAYDRYAEEGSEIVEKISYLLHKYPGRFAIGSSTYGQPLSVFINGESNVRQLTYAIRANLQHFGETPTVYAISEHALHSQIPQLISQCGYTAALMRTHFMMYGYNPTYNAPYGMWYGEDGTAVPTVPTYIGEGAEFGAATMDNWTLTRWPKDTDQSLEDFTATFSHIQPRLASRLDDLILRCEELVAHVEGDSQYQWILLEEIPELFGQPEAEFHPGANEFPVRMPWGYCGNRIFSGCRQAESLAVTAETAEAATVILLGKALAQEDMKQAWKLILACQHHDIQICGLLQQFERYCNRSVEISEGILEDSMAYIAQNFQSTANHGVAVLNTLSFKRAQAVDTQVSFTGEKSPSALHVSWKGQEIPCQVNILDGRPGQIRRAQIRFWAEVEGLSANYYEISEGEPLSLPKAQYEEKTGMLCCGPYMLALDSQGIRSLSYKGVEYVHGEVGSLFRGIINGEDCASQGIWTVRCEEGQARAEQMGSIGSIPFRFSLEIQGDRVECSAQFWHHGEKIGRCLKGESIRGNNTNGFVHEEKLRFVLQTVLGEDALGIRDLPFLVEETGDQYIQGLHWTAICDGNKGFAYANRGAMGAAREAGGAFSLPLAYANKYVWGDRYLYGEYRHEFALLPFTGGWREADIHQRALSYAYPFGVEACTYHEGGEWTDTVTILPVETTPNILLSTLYMEDGALMARFYEYMGQSGQISWKDGKAVPTQTIDLLGNSLGECGLKQELKPHQIISIRLERGAAHA